MTKQSPRQDQASDKLQAPTVITGHTNADFDCLAAIVAAGKLYPDGVLIFPGSQEKNLRDFFIQSATYLYNFHSLKDIDQSSVQRLVLVDTRQKSRLKHVQSLWEREDIEVHVYDHHPDTEEDVPATEQTVLSWGATTSILIERLRKRNIRLTPDEATLLGLGLYEDTGCFTFSSTTSHDLSAAAWLRDQGMDPNFIADMVQRELSAEQVALLNELLDGAVTHDINGIEVVVSQVTTEEFVGDFALLVHKMMDMQNLRVFFALGRMQDRIHVVARSRTPEVNVGQICASFGGGGHPYAASATVKDRTLAQVKDELFGLLYSHINPQIQIRDLMSAPPITVDDQATLQHASEVMTRYGLKAVPAMSRGTRQCAGILEHQLADRAVAHGLGQMPVSEYMGREFASVKPDTSLYPAMEIILGQRQRLVPVVEDDQLVGVITRTDLINTLIAEPARIPESMLPERRRERNIRTLLHNSLPQEVVAMLTQAGDLARDLGYHVYAVGGFVRDILLHRRNLDVDLVVEGDGIYFARRLALDLGGRVRAHKKFKTAVIILPDGQRIDVATARLEYYEHPAALPTVELSTVKMDLSRRDFTVNALAVQLDPEQFGRLVDFFGGQKDIKEKTIRVMHSLSFVEDPTRILRAVRFEQRFHFQLGGQTERLIKNAQRLNMMHKLSGSRVFGELRLILNESKPLACLQRLESFNILESIHPLLKLDGNRQRILEETERVLGWYRLLYLDPEPRPWLVYFLGLCSGYNQSQVHLLAHRLAFPQKRENFIQQLRQDISQCREQLGSWMQNHGQVSDLFFLLEPLPLEGVLYLMARGYKDPVRRHLSLYLTQYRGQEPDITGKDLQQMGLPSGPLYRTILQRVLAAKLDGKAPDRPAQLEMAAGLARQLDDTPSEVRTR